MKKMIAMVLLILSFTATVTCAYAEEASSDDIAGVMQSLNIMTGYPDGSLHLSDKLTRAQFSKMMINASRYKNSVSSRSTISPFCDVQYTSWAAPYVNVAVSNSLMKGYPDATFKPDKNVTLEEAVTVALNLLGYTRDDFGSSWPYGQLSTAVNIGLLKGVSSSAGMEITRGDAIHIIYNMLNGNVKSGTSYISAMGYEMVENVILIATSEEDSSLASGEILTSAGTFTVSGTFSSDNAGKKGNAILNVNDEIICFMPSNQQVTTYTAYAALENDIIVSSESGYTEALGLSESTTVYYKGSKTTVSNVVSKISVGDIVKVSRTSGDTNFVVISGNKLAGPLTASDSNWYGYFGISEDSAVTVMRNGYAATMSDINTDDVLYYSQSLNALWAYNKKITGIYESASPNKDQPSSVTVSGTNYSLETAAAFNKLSSKGTFSLGDSVTLLLGRDGRIADVASPTEVKVNVTGYLIDSGSKKATNSSNYSYSTYYIKIATTDGDVLEYESYKDYSSKVNSVVSVKFTNGLAAVSSVSAGRLSGTFDWNNRKIGTVSVAKDVKIMDTGTVDSSMISQYVITFGQRINNVKIDSSNILYYSKNSNGEIDSLILKNVTGDYLKYGLVTYASTAGTDTTLSSVYKCDIDGQPVTMTKTNGAYTGIKAGQPVSITMDGSSIYSLRSLYKLSSRIVESTAAYLKTSEGETYLMSSDVVVYEKTYSGYKIIPLSDLTENSDYNIAAYYDKAETSGGRIRVIIATK
jgi:hypothetical protein